MPDESAPKSLKTNGLRTERVLLPTRRVLMPTRRMLIPTQNDATTTQNDAVTTRNDVSATRRCTGRTDESTEWSLVAKRAVENARRFEGQAAGAARLSDDARTTPGDRKAGRTRVSRERGFARILTGAIARHRPSLFGAMASSAAMTLPPETLRFASLKRGRAAPLTRRGRGIVVHGALLHRIPSAPMLGARAAGASEKMFTNYVLWSKYVEKVFTNYPRPSGRGILRPCRPAFIAGPTAQLATARGAEA